LVYGGNPVKISQSILYEKLTCKYTFKAFGAENSDLVFERPLFLRDGKTRKDGLKDNQIYLAEDGMITGKPALNVHSLLLYTGTMVENFIPFFDTVFVFQNISLFDLYNAVQQIYSEYERWDEELKDILVSGGSIQEMLDKSTRIFDNPLVLYDKEFSTIIYNEKAEKSSVFSFHFDQFDQIDQELNRQVSWQLNQYVERKSSLAEFTGASNRVESRSLEHAVFASPCHSEGPRSIYTNISLRGKFQYRLMALEFFRKFTPGDSALLEYLANAIQLMINGPMGGESCVTPLSSLLRSILAGRHVEAHILDQRMTEYNWQKDQKLIWIKIPETTTEIGPADAPDAHSLCVKIREMIPHSCVFEYAGGAVALVNLEYFEKEYNLPSCQFRGGAAARRKVLLRKPEAPITPDKKPLYEKKDYANKMIILADVLDALFEQEELKAGFSDVFSGTGAILEYYRQAEFALSLGIRRNRLGRIFYFRDVKEFLLLENCLKELPEGMVCAPELLALKDYDRRYNTLYYETFYCYLRNNQSPARTIRELNIHRSTLIYRLEKIQAITGLDTVSGDKQWYFLLSCKLLEYASHCDGIPGP
jgi:hypothetical protein